MSNDDIWVRVKDKPVSCCGVLQQGWEGRVAYKITTSGVTDDVHGDILILDDGTLVWDYNCERIDKPCVN